MRPTVRVQLPPWLSLVRCTCCCNCDRSNEHGSLKGRSEGALGHLCGCGGRGGLRGRRQGVKGGQSQLSTVGFCWWIGASWSWVPEADFSAATDKQPTASSCLPFSFFLYFFCALTDALIGFVGRQDLISRHVNCWELCRKIRKKTGKIFSAAFSAALYLFFFPCCWLYFVDSHAVPRPMPPVFDNFLHNCNCQQTKKMLPVHGEK